MGLRGGTTALDGLQTRLFGGGGGGPTIPSDIAGLQFWFRGEDALPGGSNVVVSSWPDHSSNANNGTPGGTGFTTQTSVINGKAVVQINGDFLALLSSVNLGTSHSVFFVFRPVASFNDGVVIGGNATGKYTPYIDSTDIYYRPVSTDGFVSVAHGGLTTNTPYLLELVRNNTSVSFYKNAAQLSTTQTLGANTALTVVQISGLAGGVLTLDHGQIAELFVYDSALSDSNRQAMETYVNNRYAIF